MGSEGRFGWYDLLTSDVEAAINFYTEVVGWKTQTWEGGATPYTMFTAGGEPMGGVMKMPEEVAAQGVPPHWMGYMIAGDVDAKTKQVETLGGKVMHPPQDIPEVGRFSVVADPQGAAFALFQPQGGEAPEDREPRHGEVAWNELNTTDHEAAWKFYSELAGWKHTDSFEMGPEMGTYFMFESGGPRASRGGMSNMAKAQGFPPSWMYYVSVEDIDAAAKRIESSGGKVVNGPMEVPGGDKILHGTDPQGGMFALHAAKK